MSQPLRTMLVLSFCVLALVLTALPAAAKGPNLDKLQDNAGWECEDIPPFGLHCDNPGVLKRLDRGDDLASWPELVFDASTEEFLGSEIGIRADIWAGQRCPRDGDTWVEDLGFQFCHHFDTGS